MNGYVYYEPIDDTSGDIKIVSYGSLINDYSVVELPQEYLLPFTMGNTDWSTVILSLGDAPTIDAKSNITVDVTKYPLVEIPMVSPNSLIYIEWDIDGKVSIVADDSITPCDLFLTVVGEPLMLLKSIKVTNGVYTVPKGTPNKDFSVWTNSPVGDTMGWQIVIGGVQKWHW